MAEPKYSVIITTRDRSIDELLRSLSWQGFRDFETVVVDYGSSKPVTVPPPVRRIRWATKEPWNHPIALNIGIANARGRFVVMVNSDIVMAPELLATVNMLQDCSDQLQIYWRRYDLSQYGTDVVRKHVTVHSWHTIMHYIRSATLECNHKFGNWHPLTSYGDFMAVHRGSIMSIGGFDERMSFWGFYDLDIANRLEQTGHCRYWGTELMLLHRYHPQSSKETAPLNKTMYDRDFRVTKNGGIQHFQKYEAE